MRTIRRCPIFVISKGKEKWLSYRSEADMYEAGRIGLPGLTATL